MTTFEQLVHELRTQGVLPADEGLNPDGVLGALCRQIDEMKADIEQMGETKALADASAADDVEWLKRRNAIKEWLNR